MTRLAIKLSLCREQDAGLVQRLEVVPEHSARRLVLAQLANRALSADPGMITLARFVRRIQEPVGFGRIHLSESYFPQLAAFLDALPVKERNPILLALIRYAFERRDRLQSATDTPPEAPQTATAGPGSTAQAATHSAKNGGSKPPTDATESVNAMDEPPEERVPARRNRALASLVQMGGLIDGQ